MQFGSVDDMLDFAIMREEESAAFYADLASRARSPVMREVLEQFAREEMAHRSRLAALKAGHGKLDPEGKVLDLKISDYVVEVPAGPGIDYQGALILAMKREKAAFKFYTDLAGFVSDAGVRDLLLGLAQEEARHKLRFELEYDEHILTEN